MNLAWTSNDFSPAPMLIALACLVWPIACVFTIRRDATSSAPILAMFVPLAASAAAMWLAVLQFVEVSPANRALRAESMVVLIAGAVAAIIVAAIAGVRRHRPTADASTIILAAAVLASVIIALTYAPAIEIARAGFVLSVVTALAALVLLFLIARGVSTGPRIPYAAIAIFAAILLIGSVTVHCYFELTGVITHAHG